MPKHNGTQSVNPRTGESFGQIWADTAQGTVNAICEGAAEAAQQMRYHSASDRGRWLRMTAQGLEAQRECLIDLADRETGLGEARLNGELTRTVFQLQFMADVAEAGHYLRSTISRATDSPMGPLPDLRRTMTPVGPVAVFAASNFPFAFSVAGGDTASAIAAGCPVVVKAHPSHPSLSEQVAQIIASSLVNAGAPERSLALVHGVEAGARLVQHPAIKAAAFTGSLRGGRALFDLACARPDPIPFYGELGSLNPVIVTPAAARARGEEIGAGWASSLLLGGGQFCTKPGLLLAPEDGANSVVSSASKKIRESAPPYLLNEAIKERFEAGVTALEVVTTEIARSGDALPSQGFSVVPVVLRAPIGTALKSKEILEEVFGPTGIILTYETLDEVEQLLRQLGGSLTVTVHGEDRDPNARRAIDLATASAGRVIWNGYPTGVAVSPAMQHGGPWPSSTSARDTSVGSAAVDRFVRPVSYQNIPTEYLPTELQS